MAHTLRQQSRRWSRRSDLAQAAYSTEEYSARLGDAPARLGSGLLNFDPSAGRAFVKISLAIFGLGGDDTIGNRSGRQFPASIGDRVRLIPELHARTVVDVDGHRLGMRFFANENGGRSENHPQQDPRHDGPQQNEQHAPATPSDSSLANDLEQTPTGEEETASQQESQAPGRRPLEMLCR